LFIEPVASKTLNANSLDQASFSAVYSSHPRIVIFIIPRFLFLSTINFKNVGGNFSIACSQAIHNMVKNFQLLTIEQLTHPYFAKFGP